MHIYTSIYTYIDICIYTCIRTARGPDVSRPLYLLKVCIPARRGSRCRSFDPRAPETLLKDDGSLCADAKLRCLKGFEDPFERLWGRHKADLEFK